MDYKIYEINERRDWETNIGPACQANGGFFSKHWISPWGKHKLPNKSWQIPLRVIRLFNDTGTSVLFPLATQKIGLLRVASLAGPYGPYRKLLISEKVKTQELALLLRAFAGLRATHGVRFGPVADDAVCEKLLTQLRNDGWRLVLLSKGKNFICRLDSDFDAFRQRLGSAKLRKISYYERRMAKRFTTRIVHYHHCSPQQWRGILDDLITIEGNAWVSKRGEPHFLGDRNKAFWEDVFSDAETASHLHVWILYADDKAVSFCFTIANGDQLHVLANSYDEAFKDHRTGSILYRDLFVYAHEAGQYKTVNMGRGDPGYKSTWQAEPSESVVDWLAFPPTVIGKLFHGLITLRNKLKNESTR